MNNSSEIQTILGRIKHRNFQSVINRIENGQDLILLKETVKHGDWLQILMDGKVGYENVRTVQRDMQIARHLYHRLDEIKHKIDDLPWGSIFELIQKNAPEGALDFALTLKDGGSRITQERAKQIATIAHHDWLRDKVEDGTETIDRAFATAKILDARPDLSEIAQAGMNPVTLGAVAKLPQNVVDEFNRTKTVYNPAVDEQIPLGDASPADIKAWAQYEESERFQRHVGYINQWKEEKATQVGEREKISLSGTWAEVRTLLETHGFTPDQMMDVIIFVPKEKPKLQKA